MTLRASLVVPSVLPLLSSCHQGRPEAGADRRVIIDHGSFIPFTPMGEAMT